MDEMMNEVVSVEELDRQVEKLRELDDAYKEAKMHAESCSKKVTAQKEKLLKLLQETGREEYVAPHGKFSYKEEDYYRVITDPEKRDQFLNNIEETMGKDYRIAYQTVQSQALQTLCKSLIETGNDPQKFGLSEPIKRVKMSFRKK